MLVELLPLKIWSTIILQRFTVRIHSRIVEKGRAWCRLWYLLRGLDRRGSGYVRLPVVDICQLLAASSSTLYQWLREGKEAGAFRWWKCQRGNLRVALGGLFNVCRALDGGKQREHAPWGVPSEVPLHEILSLAQLRAAATASTAQRLQQLSRFAAWRKLPGPARKAYRLPQPVDFFQSETTDRLSDNSASRGSIRCVIHIGKRRVWTSRGFIPFGVSQSAIARERGMCDRTIRRHLALMDVDRRQIVQSKAEYKLAANAISQDAGSIALADNFALYARGDDYFLSESGLGGTHIHRVAEVGFARIHSRFFRYGKKPKTWLYRCNIYRPQMKLCTMSSRAREYRASTAIQPILQNVGGGGDATACKRKENSLENS